MRATGALARNRVSAAVLAACVVALGSVLLASPARADEPGETTVGYVLVQQALGHLAHDTGRLGIELATEKIDDALATTDRDGVDVNELQRAKTALEAGPVSQGVALLQRSIAAAVSQLPPAVGEETGTKIVLSPLPGRSGLTGTDRLLLAVSVLPLLLLGVGLAWYFRPRDNIAELRRKLVAAAAPPGDAGPGHLPRDA